MKLADISYTDDVRYNGHMRLHSDSTNTTLVLNRGEELIATLTAYAREHTPTGAWLQSGVGGAGSTTVAFYDLETRAYVDQTFDEPLEILSLQGNLTWVDNEPFWHIHGIFGRRDYRTVGGHVKHLAIALTGELLLVPTDTRLTRRHDDTTGLRLIVDE